MDKNGKLFGKISIIDIVLILLLIAAAVAVGFKMAGIGQSAQIRTDAQFLVTFKVDGVRHYSIDAIEAGDVFYERNAAKLGTVDSVRAEPYMEVVSRADGTAVHSPNPAKHTLYITLLCSGREDSEGYYIGGTRQVASGMEMKLKSYMINCESSVWSVEPK